MVTFFFFFLQKLIPELQKLFMSKNETNVLKLWPLFVKLLGKVKPLLFQLCIELKCVSDSFNSLQCSCTMNANHYFSFCKGD